MGLSIKSKLKEIMKREDAMDVLEEFVPGSKVSFVTDDDEIFEKLRVVEFPVISLCLSVIICGSSPGSEAVSLCEKPTS